MSDLMNYSSWLDGWGGFFPTYVEFYGQDEMNWDISMGALARYTPYASSDFAVSVKQAAKISCDNLHATTIPVHRSTSSYSFYVALRPGGLNHEKYL